MPASPLSRAEREQRRHDLECRRLLLLDEAKRGQTVQPCPAHPAWVVSVSDRRVPPPASACPWCQRGGQVQERTEPRYSEVDPWRVPEYSDRVAAALERNRHKFGPLVQPGSAEEEHALETMDILREEEIARDQKRPLGRLVCWRPNGEEIYKFPGRKGLVSVRSR